MTRRHNTVLPLPSGSDELTSSSEPAFLAVGRILRPHGLTGEVKVEIHTDYPERFAVRKRLYLGFAEHDPATYVLYALEGYRFHKGAALLKLKGIDDRTQAETLRDQWVWIPAEDAVPLKEGECYLYQILGMRVLTTEGEDLGRVTEIMETGANTVYVVRGPTGEILLPDTKDVVVDVNAAAGQMTVQLMEGLR